MFNNTLELLRFRKTEIGSKKFLPTEFCMSILESLLKPLIPVTEVFNFFYSDFSYLSNMPPHPVPLGDITMTYLPDEI